MKTEKSAGGGVYIDAEEKFSREYELKHEKYKLMEDSFKVEEPIKDSI